jgi:hypothetical protein
MPGAKSEAIVDATPKLAVRKGDLLRAHHHLQGPRPRERSHRCHVQSSQADVSVLSVHLTLVRLHEAADLRTHTAGIKVRELALAGGALRERPRTRVDRARAPRGGRYGGLDA